MTLNEPKWPTAEEVWNSTSEAQWDRWDRYGAMEAAIEACRKAFRAANDDPAADLVGSVRRDPIMGVYLKTAAQINPWRNVRGTFDAGRSNSDVDGWEVLPPVAGSPAAEAQQS